MTTSTPSRRNLTPEAKTEAQRMLADGWTYTAIGQHLDVHPSTVWTALNPDRVKERQAKRQHRLEQETPPPRKIGACFPWEGVTDDEYL